MISIFGLNKPLDEQTPGRRLVSQGILIGGSFAGAGAVVVSAFELIKANPDKGFLLLEKWGPWFFLAMFSVWALNGLLNRALDVFSGLGDRFAGSMDRIADEQVKLAKAGQDQASAMERAADRDDRDHERMSTLVDYSGQRGRQALEAVTAMHGLVEKMSAQIETLAHKKDG